MPYIDEIHPDDAIGVTKKEYEKAMRRAGRVWKIVSIMSPHGEAMRDSMRFYGTLMFGQSPLSRSHREMIAVATSQANDCHY